MKPTIGRIVIYKTTEEQRKALGWNAATQNNGNSQEVLPAMIVAVWSETAVNLQVIVDGSIGTMWVTSANQGDQQGQWDWPKREE